jgi:16S rRNA processing protein RimM
MSDLIATGIIRGTHGIDGYVKVASYSGELEHFCSLKTVTLVSGSERIEKTVDDVRVVHNAVLMKFDGIDTVEAARKYRSWELKVTRESAAPLSANEYYVDDITGCSLMYLGAPVGVILGIFETGASGLLNLELPDGSTRLVPFRDEFIGRVDVGKGEVELLVPWIIE